MKRPAVLILGSTGRLGSVMSRELAEIWDITPLSRSGGSGFEGCDLLSAACLERVLEGEYDLVVNCVAVSSTSRCRWNPGECLAVNIMWPRSLADHCRRRSIPMVHFSSDLVYSGGNPPYSEGSAAVPISLYGWSKLLADILVPRANRNSLIVRTSVLCGNAGSSRATFSEEIISGSLKRVFVNSWRNHTPIQWLAGLIPELISGGVRGLVLASGGVCRSRSAYAQELLRKHGMSSHHLELAYAPPGVPERLDLRGRYSAPSDIV